MQPANRVINHLNRRGIAYRLIGHPPTRSLAEAAQRSGVELAAVVRAVVLHTDRRLVMAILSADAVIDFDAIAELTGERMKPVPGKALRPLFKDCEPGSIPPVGTLYGLKMVVDSRLFDAEQLYFEPGSRRHLLELGRDAFAELMANATRGAIARTRAALSAQESGDFVRPDRLSNDLRFNALRPIAGLKERIQSLRELPAMPQMAGRLLQLMNQEDPSIADLAAILEEDPSLTAQLLRLARSPWYGYRGDLESVEEAITQVLGFDTALNMALGIATGRRFTIPHEGPLGLDNFWRHALYSATLCQTIARTLPASMGASPGSAYLAGLLHNIGYLLMGEMLQPEYYLLNRVIEANPEVPVPLIEKRLLVVTHGQIGAWLMRSWQMPEPLTVAVREHHNEFYQGEYSLYAKLVQLADQLLQRHQLGDGSNRDLPPNLLATLGLTEEKLKPLMESFLEKSQGIDLLARKMAA